MLYDKRWDQKADPFTLASLIAWLETRDPAETYDYCNPENCLLCRYFAAHGFQKPLIAQNNMYTDDGQSIDFPRVFQTIAHTSDWTVGGALRAARAASTRKLAASA